jgi:hypothetical protein
MPSGNPGSNPGTTFSFLIYNFDFGAEMPLYNEKAGFN